MIEKEVVYSNFVKIDENNVQFDKNSKIVISIASLKTDKGVYELKLVEINKVLEAVKNL